MRIDNTNVYQTSYDNTKNIQQNLKVETLINTSEENKEPKILKNMSFEEIQSYLQSNNIEDEHNGRAKALFDIQKFADKLDSATYDRMTNSIMKEESESQASMRYSSFPSEMMLEENPEMFHALLNTSLEQDDTVRSLIFTLDFNSDLSKHKSQNPELKTEDNKSSDELLLEFLTKQINELEVNAENGISIGEKTRIEDYKNLMKNYKEALEKEVSESFYILA